MKIYIDCRTTEIFSKILHQCIYFISKGYHKKFYYQTFFFILAVDAHVGKHLFEECITTFLRNKVVILVTHQIQYLKTADTILVMHQGKITHEGNFDYIMKSCEDISSFLIAESDEEEDESKEENKLETSDGKYFYISTISGN
jgi:hypothetical protein